MELQHGSFELNQGDGAVDNSRTHLETRAGVERCEDTGKEGLEELGEHQRKATDGSTCFMEEMRSMFFSPKHEGLKIRVVFNNQPFQSSSS